MFSLPKNELFDKGVRPSFDLAFTLHPFLTKYCVIGKYPKWHDQ